MKVIFLGTPEFAVPALKAIYNSSHEIVAVISQPDREADKKGRLKFTPVKEAAISLGLKVYQFEKVSREGLEVLLELKPDVMVTAAFGQLLSQEFLDAAPLGVFNIHASVLPLYRGSSPIQAAILNGDTVSGVTVMKTVLKMDAGDVAEVRKCPITSETTFLSLHDKLAEEGAEAIVNTLDNLSKGGIKLIAQDESAATYCKKIAKSDGVIDWSQKGEKLIRKINAFNPWPAAYTFYRGDNLKIYKAEFIECESDSDCGAVISCDEKNGLNIKCGNGILKILSVQAPGKKAMDATEFLRGYKIIAGEKLG